MDNDDHDKEFCDCGDCENERAADRSHRRYSAPKLTEYPMSGKMHKAAIEAAKCEARAELLDQVVDQIVELASQPPTDFVGVKLLQLQATLLEWKDHYEDDKRKALDAFVLLVQEKLRAETAQRRL